MSYKNMPLYQRINSITEGVKENLKEMGTFRKDGLQEFKKVLVGKGSLYSNDPVGVEFDFVAFKKPNFVWHEQTSKDDVLLAAKVIYKSSIDNLKMEIEQELFKFHSIQALRKVIIIVNTFDEVKNDYLVPYFVKNYEVLLTFPPYLNENFNIDTCPMCGTHPSRVEPWFYNEETRELLPVAEYIDEPTYFKI